MHSIDLIDNFSDLVWPENRWSDQKSRQIEMETFFISHGHGIISSVKNRKIKIFDHGDGTKSRKSRSLANRVLESTSRWFGHIIPGLL